MKWTADNDQLLFMKLLETHEISVKTEKIRDAWPADRGEVPTARAIKERITKIKAVTGAGGTQPKATPKKTPKKRSAPAETSTPPASPTPAGPSRKRGRSSKAAAAKPDAGRGLSEEDALGEEDPMHGGLDAWMSA